jgi:hypothetical protein
MKYEEFKKMTEVNGFICGLVNELKRSNELQMVVCWDFGGGSDNYWLLSPDVTNCLNIPIAIWHSDSGMVQADKEFKDWQEMIAWLFEKYTDGAIAEMYNEYM